MVSEMRKTPPLSHCPTHYSHFSLFSPGRPLAIAYGTIRAEGPFSAGFGAIFPPYDEAKPTHRVTTCEPWSS